MRHPHPMKKTFVEVQKQIEALQREADQLKREEINDVITRIKEAIQIYGLTASDLGLRGSTGGKRNDPARSSAAPKKRSTARAKYRDDSGNEWVGRGPRPQWLREALAAGKTLDDFAVGGHATGAKRNGATKSAAANKKAGKARFRDQAGNSWGGRGPRPTWLKEALASGKALEEFAV
jgi:DNA-binding protein H-NS